MAAKILVDGQIVELSIIDPKTGVDWIEDLLGNHDIGADEEGFYAMEEEEYEWWVHHVERHQEAEYALHEVSSEMSEQELVEIREIAGGVDLEDYPDTVFWAIEAEGKKKRKRICIGK
jgi:hypothetical protein